MFGPITKLGATRRSSKCEVTLIYNKPVARVSIRTKPLVRGFNTIQDPKSVASGRVRGVAFGEG